MRGSPEERFWPKVDKTDGCWLWTAGVHHGYGWFNVGGKPVGAHRFSWELANGPIPKGKEIDHMCWVTRCVNPAHLRVVTRKQHKEHRQGPNPNSTSGFRGVTFYKRYGKWRAQIGHHGKNIHGGYFNTAEEANRAFIALQQKYFTHSDLDVREPNTSTPQEERER